MPLTFKVWWEDQNAPGDPAEYAFQFLWTSIRLGLDSWAAKTLHYSMRANPPAGVNLANDFIDGISAGVNVAAQAKPVTTPIILSITSNNITTEQYYSVPGNVALIQISADSPESWDTFTISQGPYEYPASSGHYWIIGNLTFAYGPDVLQMAVFKSTDFDPVTGTGTWSRIDQAHEPANVVIFDGQYDGSNEFLRFLTNVSGNDYKLVELNMLTGLWTAPHDQVTLLAPTVMGGMIYSHSALKTGVFYGNFSSGIFYAYFDGAWHTGIVAVNVPGGGGFNHFNQVLLDPNGTRLHTWYKSNTHCRYQQISITGALGPDYDFSTNSGFNADGSPGHSVIFTDPADGIDKIGMMVDWDPVGDGRLSPACFIGWPLSNPDFNAEGLLTNPLGPSFPAPEVIDTYAGDHATCTYGTLIGSSLTLPCPSPSSGQAGVFYTATLAPFGGVAPYTFAAIGPLPVGLSLAPTTGIISGIPTTSGTFSFTFQVTDSLGATATTAGACPLNISPPAPPAPGPLRPGNNSLRWQIEAPTRPGRWFAHRYDDAIVSHYIVEPSDSAPNDQELYLLGANVWQSGGDTDNSAPINVCVLVPSNDQGDERSQKLYPDGMVQADGIGTLAVTPAFDNALSFGGTLPVVLGGPIIQAQVNIASLGDLRLYRNIGVALAWTGGPSGPRVLAWESAAYLQPYLSKRIVTQYINWSYPGYKHVRRFYPGLISTAPVLFTIETQDNRVYTSTIPSTGGQFRIIPLMIPHGCKDLAFAIMLDGQGTVFALFPDAFTLEAKGWGDPEYLQLAVWKT